MPTKISKTVNKHLAPLCAIVAILLPATPLQAAGGGAEKSDAPWWNNAWTARIPLTVDTSKEGVEIGGDIGNVPILLRLVEGSYSFGAAMEDGADIRFVAADGKTVLGHHIESYDSLMGEGFAWVTVEGVKPLADNAFFLYLGNPDHAEVPAPEISKRFDPETVLAYHFNEQGAPHVDATGNGNTSENSAAAVAGAIIGGGARFTGSTIVNIPATPTLEWSDGQTLTWSAWVKPLTLGPNAVIFSRSDAGKGLTIGLDNGIPFASVRGGGRAVGTEAFVVGTWMHLAVVANGSEIILYVNGEDAGKAAGSLPALNVPIQIGSAGGSDGFNGEIDEMTIARTARPAGFLRVAAVSQGPGENAQRLVRFGEIEESGGGSNETLEHLSLFGDIAKNMMFDGWIAVGVCVIMMFGCWSVAISKVVTLNKMKAGNDEFDKLWRNIASDLTVLDNTDEGSNPMMRLGKKSQRLMKDSPLYHIYHVGAAEIEHRLGGEKNQGQGLSARSIQAIRAALDAALTHEQHRLHNGLVVITIGIAGGPYVGLLGTVVGVMITFALIAKTGDVEVNSIAPGIASALLATVVGLLVAIPALFIYSYLNTRIKETMSNMHLFIDEFIAKIAEFYPPPEERRNGLTHPTPAPAPRSRAIATERRSAPTAETVEQPATMPSLAPLVPTAGPVAPRLEAGGPAPARLRPGVPIGTLPPQRPPVENDDDDDDEEEDNR